MYAIETRSYWYVSGSLTLLIALIFLLLDPSPKDHSVLIDHNFDRLNTRRQFSDRWPISCTPLRGSPSRREALKDYPLEFLSRMIWNDIYHYSTWCLSWNLIRFNLPSCTPKQKQFRMQSGTHSNPSDSLARLYFPLIDRSLIALNYRFSRYWRHRRLEPSC